MPADKPTATSRKDFVERYYVSRRPLANVCRICGKGLGDNIHRIDHTKHSKTCLVPLALESLQSENAATDIPYAEIAGAVARGWCAPNNAHKEMDSELAFAITAQVAALLKNTAAPQAGEAHPPCTGATGPAAAVVCYYPNCNCSGRAECQHKQHEFPSPPSATEFVHRAPFAYEWIRPSHPETSSGHYRIHDADDNAICSCYDEDNARELVARLNASSPVSPAAAPRELNRVYAIAEIAIKTGSRDVGDWVDDMQRIRDIVVALIFTEQAPLPQEKEKS